MRQKLLALGHTDITSWVSSILVPRGFEVNQMFEMPETLNTLKQDDYDMVIIDSYMLDIENICYRIAWLCRIRIAVISRDPEYDKNLLSHLGAEAFVPVNSDPFLLINTIERVAGLGPLQFEKVKILIIEDDSHVQDAIRLSFRISWPEAELFFADEGQSGINIIKHKPIDMILLDLGLPDMNGFDVLDWVRKSSKSPVIILTATRDRANVVRSVKAGANDYIVKPFKQMELMTRIRKYILEYARIR